MQRENLSKNITKEKLKKKTLCVTFFFTTIDSNTTFPIFHDEFGGIISLTMQRENVYKKKYVY